MSTLKYYLFTILAAGLLVSCSSNPYSKTNRVHKQQTKMYAKQLREFPPQQDAGGALLNYGEHQAGTTNFNLRKPNFVIIHHTALEFGRTYFKDFYAAPHPGEFALCNRERWRSLPDAQ